MQFEKKNDANIQENEKIPATIWNIQKYIEKRVLKFTRPMFNMLQFISDYNPGQSSCGHLIHFCKIPDKHLKLEFTRISPTPPLQCCISALSTLLIR